MFLAPEQPAQQSLRPNHPKLRRTHFSQNLDVTGLSFVPPFVCLHGFGPESSAFRMALCRSPAYPPPAYFASELKVSTFRRVRFCYQIILSANWTILALVVVENILPALPLGAPVSLKISVSSGFMGSAKFARLRALKISARNCTLKFSEILRMGLFLKNERSRFTRPGPGMMFRPAFPLKLRHWGGVPMAFPLMLSPKTGSEVHIGAEAIGVKNEAGAIGTAKHSVFTYCLWLPG